MKCFFSIAKGIARPQRALHWRQRFLLVCFADNQAGGHYGLWAALYDDNQKVVWKLWRGSFAWCVHGFREGYYISMWWEEATNKSWFQYNCFHLSFIIRIVLRVIFSGCAKDSKRATRERQFNLEKQFTISQQQMDWCWPLFRPCLEKWRNMPGRRIEINPACCICRYSLAEN